MISSRFVRPVAVAIALATVPTIRHTYLRQVVPDGRTTAPVEQALFRVEMPDADAIPSALSKGLPARWRDDAAITRRFGDDWLDAGAEPAMWVPSYVEPLEFNLLINPDHRSAAKLAIHLEREPFVFDPKPY